jgi:hypothetical protein
MVGPNGADAMEYDRNGNLTRLNRQGRTSTNSWGTIDGLVYTYASTTSNKINGIWDASGEAAGFTDRTNGAEYSYWPDGSLKSDASKEITLIEYNYLKRPHKITFSNNQTIEYEYDATVVAYGYGAYGRKLSKRVTIGSSTTILTEYLGSHVYVGELVSDEPCRGADCAGLRIVKSVMSASPTDD